MLDANIPWLSQRYKRFERENFFHNDVRNHNHQSTNSVNRQRSQQIRRVKSATQRRAPTPVNFPSSSRPKSAQSYNNKTQKHEKDGYYNYRTDSQNSRTPLRHRRSQSAHLASHSSDPENIRNSPVYKKYYEELERLESMDKDGCSYCPVDCRPVSSSSYRPTSSTGLLATLLPSHFERYVFWTRPCTAPPTKREYFQLPRHNNIRRGHVPHYTNFVSSINLSERDSTPSPPLHPRRAFEDVSQTKRDVRRTVQRNVRPVDKSHNIKNEYVITVENDDDDKTDAANRGNNVTSLRGKRGISLKIPEYHNPQDPKVDAVTEGTSHVVNMPKVDSVIVIAATKCRGTELETSYAVTNDTITVEATAKACKVSANKMTSLDDPVVDMPKADSVIVPTSKDSHGTKVTVPDITGCAEAISKNSPSPKNPTPAGSGKIFPGDTSAPEGTVLGRRSPRDISSKCTASKGINPEDITMPSCSAKEIQQQTSIADNLIKTKDVELLKLVEDDVEVDDFTPVLIEGAFDQSVEPHAPTPTPLASPPPQDEGQKENGSTPPVLETKTPPLPQEEDQKENESTPPVLETKTPPPPQEELTTLQTEPETEEQSEQSSPASPLPASSLLQEELKEPFEEESASTERVPTPPQSKKEVKFQEPLVEHLFEDHEATEETSRPESEIGLTTEENEEKYDNVNEDIDEKLDKEESQIEAEKQEDKEETQDDVPKSIDSGGEANSKNQIDPKEDGSQKRRVLGPPPKYKVDIFGLDSQDLLDIEMRMRRRETETSPDLPDVTDVSDVDIKKPKMQSWLRGRLALSRQSSRFEIPMDVRVLETMTPMDYLVGYCRINKRRQALYKKVFRKVDRDNDGVINIKEMEKALGEIFVDSIETEQIQTLLELIQIDQTVRLRSKMFCVIAALTERLLYQQLTTKEAAELLNHKKERIEDADFSALDWKLEGCNIKPELRKLLFQL